MAFRSTPVYTGTCPEGRVEITGEVEKVDERVSDLGLFRRVMTVRNPEGWAVWGTVPSNLERQPEPGDIVTFRGTVSHSDESESFGFFSRPTNFRFGGGEPGYTEVEEDREDDLPF